MDEKFYDRLKKIMYENDLNQSSFAERAGISPSYVTDLKKGRANISDGMVALICNVFSVNEEWLRYGNGEMGDGVAEISIPRGEQPRLTPDQELTIYKNRVIELTEMNDLLRMLVLARDKEIATLEEKLAAALQTQAPKKKAL